jgi:hypothetical protein
MINFSDTASASRRPYQHMLQMPSILSIQHMTPSAKRGYLMELYRYYLMVITFLIFAIDMTLVNSIESSLPTFIAKLQKSFQTSDSD